MVTNGVRQCTVCRIEFVINTNGNHISVEHDIKYHSPKITILKPNPVPLQFHELISNQKALGLFPSTQTRNTVTGNGYCSEETDYLHLQNTSWRCKQKFTLKHCYPDHKFFQPTPHHVYSPLWNTKAKNTVDGSWRKKWITVSHFVLNGQCMMCVAAVCTVRSYGLYCLSKGTRK